MKLQKMYIKEFATSSIGPKKLNEFYANQHRGTIRIFHNKNHWAEALKFSGPYPTGRPATSTCVEAWMLKPRQRQDAAKKSGFAGTCGYNERV
jgi:hypothetical protein